MKRTEPGRIAPEWRQVYELIQLQFPHSIMFGVQIRGGLILSYERMTFTRFFGRDMAREDRHVPEPWDDRWQKLREFCEQARDADLPQLHFRDGIPQCDHEEAPGRQFQSLPAEGVTTSDLGMN